MRSVFAGVLAAATGIAPAARILARVINETGNYRRANLDVDHFASKCNTTRPLIGSGFSAGAGLLFERRTDLEHIGRDP